VRVAFRRPKRRGLAVAECVHLRASSLRQQKAYGSTGVLGLLPWLELGTLYSAAYEQNSLRLGWVLVVLRSISQGYCWAWLLLWTSHSLRALDARQLRHETLS
jgi:hypothetical protein